MTESRRAPTTPPEILEGLRDAAEALRERDMPVPPLAGKLLRPLVAWASVPEADRPSLDRRFWLGALAVQMAHEASLLHDDVLDGAGTRRGEPTVASRRGVGAALVTGDHWLTASYRAAAMVGSPTFMELFTRGVERTVAAEAAQGGAAGEVLGEARYADIIRGKSGELFGAAAALAACLDGGPHEEWRELGLALGALYQRIDDFLDYCVGSDHGKPTLLDYRQRKWSWVLGVAGIEDFDAATEEVVRRLHAAGADGSVPLRRALERLRSDAAALADRHAALLGARDDALDAVLDAWIAAAARGVSSRPAGVDDDRPSGTRTRESGGSTAAGRGPRPDPAGQPLLVASLASRAALVGGPDRWPAYFGRHARTFHFASRLFPGWARERVAEVYAFCRFTDDLADDAPSHHDAARIGDTLEVWRGLARHAREGRPTGIALLDVVMGRMAGEGVPFDYVDGLIDGVASDASVVRIADGRELERYTWRVASVVGGWMTRLFGVHDPDVLDRAYRLGHAMQLTNILRDVGEDWRDDRVYLPADLMARHGVAEETLGRIAGGAPVPDGYRALLEELMAEADRAYDDAFAALPALPGWYARPVAVAARSYQAIHDEIRAHGYDNVTRRAWTSPLRKVTTAVESLAELVRVRRRARRAVPGTGGDLLRPGTGLVRAEADG